jgi:hypothetical protein
VNPLDIKKEILQKLIDWADNEMLGGLQKPGAKEEPQMDVEAIAIKGEGEIPGKEEKPVEEDEDMDPEMLEQLMAMHGDKDEE